MLATVATVAAAIAGCSSSARSGSPTSAVSSSSTAPASVRSVLGLTYVSGTCPGHGVQAEQADGYLPATEPAGGAPVVVLIHGGGYTRGDRTGLDRVAQNLAEHGWAAFSIDYCLPPEGTPGYPVQVQNIQAFLHYLSAHRGTYGVSTSKVALWGGSAGAGLAVETAAVTGTSAVAAAVGFSGTYDFTDRAHASSANLTRWTNYLGCTTLTGACLSTAQQASAVTHVSSSTPPMFLANSSDEYVSVDQLNDMNAALQKAGVAVKTDVIPGKQHAFAYLGTAYCPTLAFLATYLGPITGTCSPPQAGRTRSGR